MRDWKGYVKEDFKPSDAAGPKRIGHLLRAKWFSLSRLSERDLKCCNIWQISKRWTRRDSGRLVDWVRPLLGVERWRDFGLNTPRTIYSSAFTTPEGREFVGFIHGWPHRGRYTFEHTSPTIVVGSRHISLWKGSERPSDFDLSRDYRALRISSSSLFPLRIQVKAHVEDDISKLTARGFYYRHPAPIRYFV